MKKITMVTLALVMAGCASKDQIKDAIRKDPSIVFDVIEENPEKFLEVVNRAAKKAQSGQLARRAQEEDAQEKADLKNPKKPALNDSQRLIGDSKAKIVIVEFADFQCPACGMAHNYMKEFLKKHKGEVQFYYKNMPLDFHKMAYPAAQYFEAIKLQSRDKALQYHEYLFENQRSLSDSFLKKAAEKVGADMKRLAKDIESDAVKKAIDADMAEFQKFGFNGTPAIILNGVSMYGAQPVEELERVSKLTTQ